MSLEKSPLESSNEGKSKNEIEKLEAEQTAIKEIVKKARKKNAKNDSLEIEPKEQIVESEVQSPIESEPQKPIDLAELAKMVKKIQGLSDEEAKELVQRRRDLIVKHSDYIWAARQDLHDIDNDIWVITTEKKENETNEDYAKKRNTKDISTLSEAVKRGVITLKEFNDYKAAKEAIEGAINHGVEEKELEEANIILEKSEDDFAKRIIKFLNDHNNEKESNRKKISADLGSVTGNLERQITEIDEKIIEDPKKVPLKKGLMKELVDSVRKIWLGKDGILGEKNEDGTHIESVDGFYGKKLNDSRNIKKQKEEDERIEKERIEKERIRDREMFLDDLKITTEIIKEKHEQVKNNLKNTLSPEEYSQLEGVMSETKTDINQANFNKINSIRKSIVEHILIDEKPVLKEIAQITPWAQMDSNYGSDMSHLLKPETHERLRFYKEEQETDNSIVKKIEEIEKEISRLQGENTIIKVLLGKKETSEIREAFGHRKYAEKSGKFKELREGYIKDKEAEKKREELRVKNTEKKKLEKTEIEKTIHEELKEDFYDFVIPVLDGKKIIEKHPVAIRFEAYVTEKRTVMLKVVEIIDKDPKNKDEIKPKEIQGFTLGRSFDLETLSGAPQWIKDGLNDEAKEKLINTIVIKENQK